MIRFFPLLFCTFFTSGSFGQKDSIIFRDTSINFVGTRDYEILERYEISGYKNEGVILHVEIIKKDSSYVVSEYSRINDTIYSCINYYSSGRKRSEGVMALNKLIGTDSCSTHLSYPPYENAYSVLYILGFTRTGNWLEWKDED